MTFSDGVKTLTSGPAWSIAWDAKSDAVWTVAEKIAEKMEATMAARRQGRGGCEKGMCPMDAKCSAEQGDEHDGRGPFRDDEF